MILSDIIRDYQDVFTFIIIVNDKITGITDMTGRNLLLNIAKQPLFLFTQ